MVWQSSLLGTVLGIIAPYLGFLTALPPWQAQIIVVCTTTPLMLLVNHFLKRWLNKRWPDRNRRKGDTGE